MSLKAKLEAVIYAAEEPVTLAHLSALFTEEALEWKATQLAAEPVSELLSFPDEPEDLVFTGPEQAEPHQQGTADIEANPGAAHEAEANPEVTSLNVDAAAAAPATATEFALKPDPEAEAQREAKLREREARDILRKLLAELIETYQSDDRGIEIREIAGGYRMSTKPECHDAVRSFVKSLKPALKLSLPALETLAVVAYKQPITAPEVGEIRGVDSAGVLGSLIGRKLVTTAGRKQVIGRPILYKTTKEFLMRFGLKDSSELPSMEEFEKMATLELADPEDVAEEALVETPAAEAADDQFPLTKTEDKTENKVVDAETAVEADSEPRVEAAPIAEESEPPSAEEKEEASE